MLALSILLSKLTPVCHLLAITVQPSRPAQQISGEYLFVMQELLWGVWWEELWGRRPSSAFSSFRTVATNVWRRTDTPLGLTPGRVVWAHPILSKNWYSCLPLKSNFKTKLILQIPYAWKMYKQTLIDRVLLGGLCCRSASKQKRVLHQRCWLKCWPKSII